jgi:hypothetical protein
MTIPYSALTLLGSVLTAFLLGAAAKSLALPLAAAGAVTAGCSVLSLKQWRKGQSTTLSTLLSAGKHQLAMLWKTAACQLDFKLLMRILTCLQVRQVVQPM